MQGAIPTTVGSVALRPLAITKASLKRKAHLYSGTLDPLPFPLPVDSKRPNLGSVYVCEQCGRDGWRSSSALARHEQSHLSNEERQHHCKECGKSFTQKTALNTHKNIHTGYRPHRCRNGCGQKFADPSSRTRHENELHNPAFGWKCLRPGCNDSFKRKNAFAAHMVNIHQWPQGKKLPDSVYIAAKNKCASDYAELVAKNANNIGERPEIIFDNDDFKEEKPLFNGKRLRSDSPSSDDHIKPPPAKKRALEPVPSRRNAVCSIEIPTPQTFTPAHVDHKREDSDNLSTSTASSFVGAFSGTYHPTGHEFTNGSPPIRPLDLDQHYQKAIERVVSPSAYPTQGTSMGVSMHPGAGGYSVAPASVSSRAPVAMPEPIAYPYSNTGAGIFTSSSWSTNNDSYGSKWPLGNEVAQTPHGVSPAHITLKGPPARGFLPPSRSDLFHAANNSGFNLCNSGHQREQSSGSPSLVHPWIHPWARPAARFGITRRSRGPRASTVTPPLSDSRMQGGGYELELSGYPCQSHRVPRSVNGVSDHERSYY
ncbi:hypothetical protein OPQ81_009781 [Rhizoctonia solani]|nr:hypothetical protein OPQ81_009781 [Rhizoctonia solani]